MAIIDEQFRKIVVFLWSDRTTDRGIERTPVGTGFLVAMEVDGISFRYLATARHVIDATRSDGPLLVRINLQDGTAADYETRQDDWLTAASTDVAVLPFVKAPNFDTLTLSASRDLPSDEDIRKDGVGIGDDVFLCGLFSQEPGQTRALPVVRFGRIARMMDEPIAINIDPANRQAFVRVDAYLVEAMSWAGQSGSPVFVHHPLPTQGMILAREVPAPKLLGLVHGHVRERPHVEREEDSQRWVEDPQQRVNLNAGIAVVIPASTILELLNDPQLVDARSRAVAPRGPLAQPDGGSA